MGGSSAAGSLSASGDDPLITEVKEWAQITGDGVDATPYGLPIEFEKEEDYRAFRKEMLGDDGTEEE